MRGAIAKPPPTNPLVSGKPLAGRFGGFFRRAAVKSWQSISAGGDDVVIRTPVRHWAYLFIASCWRGPSSPLRHCIAGQGLFLLLSAATASSLAALRCRGSRGVRPSSAGGAPCHWPAKGPGRPSQPLSLRRWTLRPTPCLRPAREAYRAADGRLSAFPLQPWAVGHGRPWTVV